MDFPFSSGIGAGIFTQKTVAGSRGTATITDQSSSPSESGDAVKQFLDESKSVSASTERAGKYLTLSNVKNALDIASSAITEIADLNARKADLALKASDLATGVQTQQLSDEAQDIESQIQNIYSTASYNGKTLLNGNSFGYSTSVSSADLQDAIVVPGLSGLIGSTSLGASYASGTFATQQDAATNYESIVTRAEGLGTISANYQSAQGKATTLLETTLVSAAQSPDALTDVNEAQKLATDIANQIGSQFTTEESTRQLIDSTIGTNPDTKKIADLLSA